MTATAGTATASSQGSSGLRTGSALRDNVATLLVSGVSALFGVALIEATVIISGAVAASAASGSGTIAIALGSVSAVFLMLAVYVAAVVTANTFATIVAGRRRSIALIRVLGAEASGVRRALALEGLVVGAVGAVLGLALGVLAAGVVVSLGTGQGWLPETSYGILNPALAAPFAIVVLTTWLAAWVGCRTVTTVSPLEATAAAADPVHGSRTPTARTAAAIVLLVVGAALVVIGIVAGMLSPLALVISFFGGILSFTAVIAAAGRIMPWVLRVVGTWFGRSPAARIATANAARYPERSTRATMALVIGVTLVTTFAVALTTYSEATMHQVHMSPAVRTAMSSTIGLTIDVFSVLVGFSALIAAVGLVNTLTVGMLQRRRELGLLRALGFSTGQVRTMILVEGAQLTVGAVVFGLVLGGCYGWVAAQSLMGSLVHGFVAPSLPWPMIAVVVGGGILLTLACSVIASRRAGTVSPVAALAVE
ncbi:ABC transporter permease [Rathayibacter sp. CAU 1779]